MKTTTFQKLVWAVDVLEFQPSHENTLAFLKGLSESTGAVIEPIFVLASPFGRVEEPSDFEEAFRALAEKRLREMKEGASLPLLRPGRIVSNAEGSIRAGAQLLIEEAEDISADAIIVATHSRSGISRFFLGSFAETLIMKSPLPVITLNPGTKVPSVIRKILMPSMFQERHRPGFEAVVHLAKSLKAQLTLFYKEPQLPAQYMSPLIQHYIARQAPERRRRAEEWESWSEKQGVACAIRLDNQPGAIVNAVNEVAAEGFDLIALVSEYDEVSVPLLGSVARQLVRSAPCPVWVTRAED